MRCLSFFCKIFLTFAFLLVVVNVNASECTDVDIKELKEIAERITFSAEFIEESVDEDYFGFVLTGYNLNKNLVLSFPNGLNFYTDSQSEIIGSFNNGYSLNIDVYGSENHVCESVKITTLNFNFSNYNVYSQRDECNNKQIDICQKWFDSSNVSEDEFKKIIDESNKFDVYNDNNNSLNKYILYFSCFGMIVILISIFLFAKKRNKRVKIDL